jgi:hypothetical protein
MLRMYRSVGASAHGPQILALTWRNELGAAAAAAAKVPGPAGDHNTSAAPWEVHPTDGGPPAAESLQQLSPELRSGHTTTSAADQGEGCSDLLIAFAERGKGKGREGHRPPSSGQNTPMGGGGGDGGSASPLAGHGPQGGQTAPGQCTLQVALLAHNEDASSDVVGRMYGLRVVCAGVPVHAQGRGGGGAIAGLGHLTPGRACGLSLQAAFPVVFAGCCGARQAIALASKAAYNQEHGFAGRRPYPGLLGPGTGSPVVPLSWGFSDDAARLLRPAAAMCGDNCRLHRRKAWRLQGEATNLPPEGPQVTCPGSGRSPAQPC